MSGRLAAVLALCLPLSSCYASHGLDGDGPSADLDASVRFDASPVPRDASGRDAAAPRDASRPPRDAQLPSVPDAGYDPGTLAGDYYTFCARSALLSCEPNARCCDHPDRVLPPGDCLDILLEGCATTAAELEPLRAQLTWDREAADAWLRSMIDAAPYCDPIEIPKQNEFLVGSVREGGDCTPPVPPRTDLLGSWARYVCVPGLRCEITGTIDRMQGRCTALGEIGDPCTTASEDCEPGLFCDVRAVSDPRAASPGLCMPRAPVGGECTTDFACDALYCTREGQCAPLEARDTWCIAIVNPIVDRLSPRR
ncbi:hypothetical protein [Sandaracinus amylolyticus]|uniref:hypothetical protein n=1 Tax=Sandaracinus amylolyticus TaxID=927083 RepID=UPI001F25B1CF|nr:hypothetical protein [Sandaracinus amylolyticus]UJR78465.1 Hypothetical protein I5071_4950 [Sandaracinus amylolyticus]